MNIDEILKNYNEAIALEASQTGLPERLIAAVIQVESAGNTHAIRFEPSFYTMVQREGFQTPAGVSKLTEFNARCFSWGLMQIMGQVARERGCTEPYLSALCEPATGIYWGCRQLAKCRDRFLKTYGWAAVTAAYNGGFGAVKKDGSFTNAHYPKAVLAALGGSWPD
ncbi:lytic transglycosylase domain-containing protein [Bilophila sp.]|uniref:lytic transglycosylase domain-containing protein n=1 Tax=Bilophila sp. TaxID=1929485 RepID=UPI003076C260